MEIGYFKSRTILATESWASVPLFSVHFIICQMRKDSGILAVSSYNEVSTQLVLTASIKFGCLKAEKKMFTGHFTLLLNKHLLLLVNRFWWEMQAAPRTCSRFRSNLSSSRWGLYLLHLFCMQILTFFSLQTLGRIGFHISEEALTSVERNQIYGEMWK